MEDSFNFLNNHYPVLNLGPTNTQTPVSLACQLPMATESKLEKGKCTLLFIPVCGICC